MKPTYVKAAEDFQSEIMQKTTVLDDMIAAILGKAATLDLEGKSTRYRIEKLKKYKAILSNRYDGDFDALTKELDYFEKNIAINVKHGKVVEGLNVIAFSKGNKVHRFDEDTIDRIRKTYAKLVNGLHEISYRLEHGKTM